MKQYRDFVVRFPADSEIGRDVTEGEVAVYWDNGRDVGVWRVNRRTTVGEGEVLSFQQALETRAFFRAQGRQR